MGGPTLLKPACDHQTIVGIQTSANSRGVMTIGAYGPTLDSPLFDGQTWLNPHLVGGAITILKNMKVNGKDDIPYIMENTKCSKLPTSHCLLILVIWYHPWKKTRFPRFCWPFHSLVGFI